MIIKQCQFAGADDKGAYVHLVHAGYNNDHLVKQAFASKPSIEEAQYHLKNMPKNDKTQSVLLSALGAAEYWGSNSNSDHFGMGPLIHIPPNWHDLSHSMQKMAGPKWEWGYPTFYAAHAFRHHKNSDPARAFGLVEYVTWDPRMKRVLLIVEVDRQRARENGAENVVDGIDNGEFADVSMGARVPYDLCSICTEWSRITGNPQKDLAEHRRKPIRGLSVSDKDYCQHLLFESGKIYPDGRRVCMVNLHPRFFDISFVFIGADKASKVMAKLAGQCPIRPGHKGCSKGCWECDIPSAHVYEVWDREKTAERCAVPVYIKGSKKKIEKESQMAPWEDPQEEELLRSYFSTKLKKSASIMDKFAALPLDKRAEIIKRVRSQFSSAMDNVGDQESDIPKDILERMSQKLPESLGTAGSLGIILKPKEFQHSMLCSLGHKPLSDELASRGHVFKGGLEGDGDFRLSGNILPNILRDLLPMVQERSAFGPVLHRRMARITIAEPGKPAVTITRISGNMPSSISDHPIMQKVGSAYLDYRKQMLQKVAGIVTRSSDLYPEILGNVFVGSQDNEGLVKEGQGMVQSILGMFPVTYLNRAYLPEPVSRFVEGRSNLGGLQAYEALSGC